MRKVKLFEDFEDEDVSSYWEPEKAEIDIELFNDFKDYMKDVFNEEEIENNDLGTYVFNVKDYIETITNGMSIKLHDHRDEILLKILEEEPSLYAKRKDWFDDEVEVPEEFKRSYDSGLLNLNNNI